MKALETVYGDYDKSYDELPKLLVAMREFVSSTVFKYNTKPVLDEEGQVVRGYRYLHMLFWAFKPAIEGFKYCKRMVQVDGTWLYGKYKHVLLVAVAQDGENHVIPIAYAIVDKESAESWYFFLTNLREHVIKDDGVCIISDRHAGYMSVIEHRDSVWTPPHAYPRYYIRHIGKNSFE